MKLDGAEAAVPNQTAAADHVDVGNIVTLRKYDGLTIENTGAPTVTTELRIVLALLMNCSVIALPGNLRAVAVKVDQMNLDSSRQAQGKNTSATEIKTNAGQAEKFANGNFVRIRKAPSIDAVNKVTAVDKNTNVVTLQDALSTTDFPANSDVTVTLLAQGKSFDAENIDGAGDHIKIKTENPSELKQADIIRVRLQSDANVAEVRLISAVPAVVAVVDNNLPATHTSNLTVRRFAPVASTLRDNADAPQVQLEFKAPAGAVPAFAAGDFLFLQKAASARIATPKNESNWGKVQSVAGQSIFLTDPVDILLDPQVDIDAITPTGLTTTGASLDESKVLVPSSVFSTDSDDPDLEPLTHREATTNHEMRHVFQYAYLGPFFFSLPLPWLVSLGFSFGDSSKSASDLMRHFSFGVADDAIALLLWGASKIAGNEPSAADVTGTVSTDLKTITFAASDAGKITAFTSGAPASVKKGDFAVNSVIDSLNTGAETITLRVPLPSDKFAGNDSVKVQVSAFEKIRKGVKTYLGSIDQLWSDHIPTAWGQVLSKFLNRDSWFPFIGFYWWSWLLLGRGQEQSGFEQDAAFHSGDLYSSIVVSNPSTIFVGQFSRIYGFLEPRTWSPSGDVADTLSKQREPLEFLTVELPSAVKPGSVAGAVTSSSAGQVRFRENYYLPMSEKVENVVGALFAASEQGDYILHAPGELDPNKKVAFAPDFLKTKKISVKLLGVTPVRDSTSPLFETENVTFQIAGDNSAEYHIRYKQTPGPPTPQGTINGLRFTAPVLSAPGNVTHSIEITATYQETHPVFHGPGQIPGMKLTADQRTNVCQDLTIVVSPITAPTIAAVQAGKKVDFDTPIPARSVRITSSLPAGAIVPARVVLGTGRPAHNTFFAPNSVSAATDVTFELTFGTAPNSKPVTVTVHVNP